MIDKHPRVPLVDGNRKGRPAPSGSCFELQLPKCIAGGVKTGYFSVGIRAGNHRVGLTADQARFQR